MLRTMLAASLTAAAILAQTAPPPPAFDVASIRPSSAQRRGGEATLGENIKATPGRLSMRRVSLKACIAWAYHIFEYQVNGPDWIGSRTYDVVAKAGGPAAEPELRLMLQTLLADRLHLMLHPHEEAARHRLPETISDRATLNPYHRRHRAIQLALKLIF